MRGGGSLWDSDLVAGVAFHPRKCPPGSRRSGSSGGWVDGEVQAGDGVKLAYRLYTPGQAAPLRGRPVVLVYFHANAELCTDLETEVRLLFECGFCAVLCPEFRGYAWSGGKPRLASLCPDAVVVMEAVPEILSDAGLPSDCAIVAHGRSLGSICAVHVAALSAERRLAACVVSVLVVESGVVSLLDLPMVQQLGMMMPDLFRLLKAEPNPLQTLAELGRVTAPTLVIHGDLDRISPVEQAVAAHRACTRASVKKLVRFPRCEHNDIRHSARRAYYAEMRTVCAVASGTAPEATLAEEVPEPGFLDSFLGALRCVPGVRRCLSAKADGQPDQ